MPNRSIIKEWFEKADEDFEFACSSFELDDFFAQICFHFQQAAEKYLKTFIIAKGLEFRPVHNLLELLKICIKNTPSLKEINETCRFLNPFYIDTRYPVHWASNYNKEIALKAKSAAGEIRNRIKHLLKIL